MESWVFLLVGGLGAVGAALSLGTLAAWIRYERTGELPGGANPDAPDDHDAQGTHDAQGASDRRDRSGASGGSDATGPADHPGPEVRRRLLVRIVIGAVVAVVCAVTLAQQGLLGGPVLG